jgi:hypothetical protein
MLWRARHDSIRSRHRGRRDKNPSSRAKFLDSAGMQSYLHAVARTWSGDEI